ncbi:hypothetical protein NE237_023280 [Protea cynaroides]|uniref:Uncharacterized protein n=1 Tax=Protea cynaroides TaxID=273540 RepID=A0A9Q0HDM3_9MAGN|nr:hypothetical protein NE237_023280 [Protea cynaroides]
MVAGAMQDHHGQQVTLMVMGVEGLSEMVTNEGNWLELLIMMEGLAGLVMEVRRQLEPLDAPKGLYEMEMEMEMEVGWLFERLYEVVMEQPCLMVMGGMRFSALLVAV